MYISRPIVTRFVSITITITAIAASAMVYGQGTKNEWTGFYIGGYGGGGITRTHASTSTIYATPGYFAATSVTAVNSAGGRKMNGTGFTGGGTFGGNYQKGRLVVGAEADMGAFAASKTVRSTGTYPCCGTSGFAIDQTVKTRWLLTVRPRIGAAFGKSLVYGTAGLAVADAKYTAAFSDNYGAATESASFSKQRAGWTAGGGVEVKFAKRWSAKGEYLFTDIGTSSTTSTNLTATSIATRSALIPGPSTAYPNNVFYHAAQIREHSIRFGINFHF